MPKQWDEARIKQTLNDIIQGRILTGQKDAMFRYSISEVAGTQVTIQAATSQKKAIEEGLAGYFSAHGAHPLKSLSFEVLENTAYNPLERKPREQIRPRTFVALDC